MINIDFITKKTNSLSIAIRTQNGVQFGHRGGELFVGHIKYIQNPLQYNFKTILVESIIQKILESNIIIKMDGYKVCKVIFTFFAIANICLISINNNR